MQKKSLGSDPSLTELLFIVMEREHLQWKIIVLVTMFLLNGSK